MSKQNLIDIIREKSENLCSEILENSIREADEILSGAAHTAEGLRNEVRNKIQAETDLLRHRYYNTLSFHTNARRYEMKSAALRNIWLEAEETLVGFEISEEYKDVLRVLFDECLGSVPDDSIVHAGVRDAEIVKDCIESSGRKLMFEEDSRVHGGVEFHWPDGSVVLKNTLIHRLEKLKAEGNAEISKLLFPTGEVSGS